LPDPAQLSPVRAIYSLRESHITFLAQAVAAASGPWSIARHEGYDGDLMVLMTPPGDGDADYVVSRTRAGFHLAATVEDTYQPIGVFATLAALVRCLRAQRTLCDASGMIA
jgi:hypothetical protein